MMPTQSLKSLSNPLPYENQARNNPPIPCVYGLSGYAMGGEYEIRTVSWSQRQPKARIWLSSSETFKNYIPCKQSANQSSLAREFIFLLMERQQ